MADLERTLLNHYNLSTLYPTEWPHEIDGDASSSDEERPPTKRPESKKSAAMYRRKSRYHALERTVTSRATVPGAERSNEGIENLVQKDESDPLGMTMSVVQVLRQRSLPVEEDLKLRNRFLLSSTTFSPTLFLSQVHSQDSTDTLLQGLEFLSRSIEKKSASLKVLVETNIERFVRAKATIDNVYTEMREQGREADSPQSSRRPHSRHASKSSGHFRNASGTFNPGLAVNKTPSVDKKKNALLKESEYGVLGVRSPLSEAAVKAEEIWGPALGGQEKETALKAIVSAVETYRGIFEVGGLIQDAIKRREHDFIVEEYRRARKYADDARDIVEKAKTKQNTLSEAEVQRIIITARMWSDVDEQIASYKRDLWKRLAGTHFTKQPATDEEEKSEEHMGLISTLLDLGVEDNPIWVWLLSRYDYLKTKIVSTSERSKVEIEILRRGLANAERPGVRQMAAHLMAAGTQGKPGHTVKIDSPKVLEMWEHVFGTLTSLLSTQGGILGEVIEFWETAQSFIDGKAQKNLPNGPNGQSSQHHRLSMDGVRDLRSGATELISLIRDHILSFFSEPPIEDISLLFSPLPDTPNTPRTPRSGMLSPMSATRFVFDPNNLPPPSPKRGDPWEKYAFWPPYANALSGVLFLSKILVLIGTAASDMGTLSIMKDEKRATELKQLVGGVRERCVQAVCAAWNGDSENCKFLEDWTRSPERRDLTKMPDRFMDLEGFLLGSLQKILYVSEAMNKPGSAEVVVPPPTKLLQMVRAQFVTTIYQALSGMVEIADKSQKLQDDWDATADGITVPLRSGSSLDSSASGIDSSNRNVRILVTLSNLQCLRNEIVPQLISQFEANFSVKLTDESKTIRDVLGQIDAKLFQSYVRPISERLTKIVAAGIASSTWEPRDNRPTDASSYVYTVLLALVLVHTEVSTTAATLTPQILKHLLEQVSLALIESFKRRSEYSLRALMQATLDVEFMAQTLGNFTTDKASETQSAIYLALDERTDNDARVKLQVELGELRTILKRLREGTKGEFACFKKPRRDRTDRPVSRQ